MVYLLDCAAFFVIGIRAHTTRLIRLLTAQKISDLELAILRVSTLDGRVLPMFFLQAMGYYEKMLVTKGNNNVCGVIMTNVLDPSNSSNVTLACAFPHFLRDKREPVISVAQRPFPAAQAWPIPNSQAHTHGSLVK